MVNIFSVKCTSYFIRTVEIVAKPKVLSVVYLSQQPTGNWFLLGMCLHIVCKYIHQQFLPFFYAHALLLTKSSLQSGLALWLTLTRRMCWLWCYVTFSYRPLEVLQLYFHLLHNQPPGKRVLSWTPRWWGEGDRVKVTGPAAGSRHCHQM